MTTNPTRKPRLAGARAQAGHAVGDPVPVTGRTEVSRLLGPVASPSTAVLIGHLSRCSAQDRKAMIEALHARVGNRRVARMIVSSEAPAAGAVLHRSANGSKPPAAAVRRIILDANVFDQLSSGNILAAKKLKELAANHQVFVSWHGFGEWVAVTQDRKQANAAKRIIEHLGIRMAPPAPREVLDQIRAKNTYLKGKKNPVSLTILSANTDLMVAAEAKALGAEVWSFDGAYRNNSVEQVLGVKVAPESRTIARVNVPRKNRKHSWALRMLGIKEDAVAGVLPAGTGAPGAGGGTAGKSTEKAATGAGETAATQLEKAGTEIAGDVGTKGEKLYRRLAAKIGVELLEGLVPDPLDAIGLMVDFAGSYAEARKAIRGAGLRDGFAVGFAAYLVVPRWGWAKNFAHAVASRDVATQVVGAVGVAENAFNEGLVRGFLYGEKHTAKQADTVRQKAFWALQRLGRTPGRSDGDDLYTFGRDDVYEFAAVLRPTAASALAEADRRRKKRQESEELRKQMERWKRVPVGADKW